MDNLSESSDTLVLPAVTLRPPEYDTDSGSDIVLPAITLVPPRDEVGPRVHLFYTFDHAYIALFIFKQALLSNCNTEDYSQ